MPVPDAYIKKVAIELHGDYELSNVPRETEKAGVSDFIGRQGLTEKFIEFLKTSERGIYLVTGYRGMGKTSFVNHVIGKYKREEEEPLAEKIKPIHLTIAQSNPKEEDILKLLVSSVYHEHINSKEHRPVRILEGMLEVLKITITLFCALFAVVSILWLLSTEKASPLKVSAPTNHVLFVFACLMISLILSAAAKIFLLFFASNHFFPFKDLKILFERCHSAFTENTSSADTSAVKGLSLNVFQAKESLTRQFPIASLKEIEFELQRILKKAKDKGFRFIIIFDELDKVDPAVTASYMYEALGENKRFEDSYQKDLRDRKQAIINIVSGLKNFFTNAHASFIFIAGHEMFDASLADIADRQSSISSIFTYIFNVESFLKEKDIKSNSNNASLSNAIEEYMKCLFIGRSKNETTVFEVVRNFMPDSESELIEEFPKIYFILQNFIAYLVYRSNGSPKKLIKAIHEFISIRSDEFEPEKTIVLLNPNNKNEEKPKRYLFFNYYNQYRIGFITYLYRPFIIHYGRSFKVHSDNIVLSTPYLFDHLLKFHPFAFSLTNLELIPEVLSTNKTPSLKEHLGQIIDYLKRNHVRDTDVELFDFKYYSRTQNELRFISKVFEQESAAFNFTLDEGYLVKLQVRSKIKELRSIYSKFLGSGELASQQIFSIAHLNGILGDLSFFDQEYDDAIVAYSDAIRPINHLKVSTLNMRDFITLIRNKLKLGLSFEKISSYEEALAFYSDSAMDTKRFIQYRLDNAYWLDDFGDKKRADNDANEPPDPPVREGSSSPHAESGWYDDKDRHLKEVFFYSSALNDVLQIVIQAFLAKMVIQEKMGIEGINFSKLNIGLSDFITLANRIGHSCNRNHLIVANAYLLTGKVFYFKNSAAFTEFDEGYPRKSGSTIEPLLRQLHVKFNSSLIAPIHVNHQRYAGWRRQPVISLYFYILGLCEVFKSQNVYPTLHEDICATDSPANISFLIVDFCAGYLTTADERFTGFHYRYIATLLSNIGDCLLSSIWMGGEKYCRTVGPTELLDQPSVDQYMASPDKNRFASLIEVLRQTDRQSFSLVDVLKCYYLSGMYYSKYGRTVSCSYQYRKLLQILRLAIRPEPNQHGSALLTVIKDFIVIPLFDIVCQNSGHDERHMLIKATEHNHIAKVFAYHNISNHPESREVIFLYKYIEIKITKKAVPLNHIVSNNYSFASQYERVMELDLCAKNAQMQMDVEDQEKGIPASSALNCLFSLISIIRILKIYGTDYSLGISFLAYTHFRIAKFLEKEGQNLSEVKIDLEKYLGKGSMTSLDQSYHYRMAKDLYERTVSLHTGGSEYKKAINGMIYLEDDFNDNGYHFGAALDRYLMINEFFRTKMEECKIKIDKLNKEKEDLI